MSSDPIANKHRRLADALEAARAEGVEVDAVESYTVDGELVATVDVGVGALQEDSVDAAEDGTHDAVSVDTADDWDEFKTESLEAAEKVDNGEVDSASGSHELEEGEDEFDPEEAVERLEETVDELEGDLEDGEQYYIGEEPEPEDTDEQPRPEDLEAEEDPEPPADSLAAEVLATLRDEGELAGPEIKTITGAGSDMYTALGDLQDDDLVEKRKDPDDGRRTLYRPAGWLVEDEDEEEDDEPEWNGRDPETIVADSSLPARVVLDDILEAVATVDTVIDLAEQLDVDVDNLGPVCWHLTLKQADSLAIVSDVDERVETIREVVSA